MDNLIGLGNYKDKKVGINRADSINGHMLVTGGSGTGKTNLLKIIVDQIHDDGILMIDYGNSFKDFAATERISAECTDVFHNFCRNIDAENLGAVTNAIQAAYRFGPSQKATIMKALNKMAKKCYFNYELKPEDQETAFYDFLTFENGRARKDWALLAFILDTECGGSGTIIAARLMELVVALYGKKAIETKSEGICVVEFPTENGSGVSEMVELYLWDLWRQQVHYYRQGQVRTITIVIDECQVLNWKKGSIAEKMLSEGRKFGISMLLSTQFTKNNFPQRVITSFMQSGIRLIFQPPESDLKEIAQSLDLVNWHGWFKKLQKLPKGHCIACGMVWIGERLGRQKIEVTVPLYTKNEKNTSKETIGGKKDENN